MSLSPRPGDCDRSLTRGEVGAKKAAPVRIGLHPAPGSLIESSRVRMEAWRQLVDTCPAAASRQGGLLSGLLMEGSGGGRREIDSSAGHPPTRSFAPAQDDNAGDPAMELLTACGDHQHSAGSSGLLSRKCASRPLGNVIPLVVSGSTAVSRRSCDRLSLRQPARAVGGVG